jgi:hypothetical protein
LFEEDQIVGPYDTEKVIFFRSYRLFSWEKYIYKICLSGEGAFFLAGPFSLERRKKVIFCAER